MRYFGASVTAALIISYSKQHRLGYAVTANNLKLSVV